MDPVRGFCNLLSAEAMAEVKDVTRTRNEVGWELLTANASLQWGRYTVSFYRRSTNELLLREWRDELTVAGLEPDFNRALCGGYGRVYCGPVRRSYPNFVRAPTCPGAA
jgi:hypothetical protein